VDKQLHGPYVIVSPVKDEEKYIRETLESVTQQTVLPLRWIIVDDGSHDQTPDIVQEYASRLEWIRVVQTPGGPRQPGSAVIRAFNYGLEFLRNVEFSFIVKLDCDLRLPLDYFEQLLSRFALDPKLGIASGVYQEERNGHTHLVKMPPYHAAGASKMMRSACFDEIGGFVCERGWDTLDEIRAQIRGWHTCHFDDLVMDHLKPEGTGIGLLRTNVMHGEIFYKTGGGALFFLGKAAARALRGRPPVLGGMAMLYGFFSARFRSKRLVSSEEARHYRSLLNRRIFDGMKRGFGRAF
jgi:glycosyltransferase involved in cell wall biosynthesis